jgi:hypothetical protein
MKKEKKEDLHVVEFNNCKIELSAYDNVITLDVEGGTKECFILLQQAAANMPHFREAILHCVKFWELEKKELNKK